MQANASATVVGERSELSEQLISRGRALVDLLAEHAAEAEELRRLSPTVVDALRQAELLSLGPPAALGGHGVDLDTFFEIGYAFGRGCTSTAWCWQIWTLHAWFTGFLPPKAHEEIFANGPDVIISSGYNSSGAIVEAAEGGCMLSGRWAFSSGVDYADWVILGAALPGVTRPAGALNLFMFVPRDQVTVVDDWYVMGLKGTGSKTMTIKDPVYVPEHRFLDMHEAENGPARSLYDRASYGLPPAVSMGFVVISPFLGAARAVIDGFADDMKVRQDSLTFASKSEKASIQVRIGEAEAEVDAALYLARSAQRELLDMGARGETLTLEQRAAYRLYQVYGIELARRAVTRLFEISGTAALFSASPMYRRFSDIYAGVKHFSHRWDEYTESYGRVRLGLEPNAIQR
jgi:3-hydroxy-9,10-secoandrosta-1,3,5(10)-triene-9,17-dione monooxygenase